MALPTTLYGGVIIALNGSSGPKYFRAGGSLMKPAMVCTHDSDTAEVKICGTSDKPFGIIGCDADHDLSTVYTAGERIPVYLIGSGVEVWIMCGDAGNMSVTKGAIMATADTATYVGMIKMYEHVAITTDVSTAQLAQRNITSDFHVGKSQDKDTVTATINKYLPVVI